MSNLVDMWTTEFAKLREKGARDEAAAPGAPSPRVEPEVQSSGMPAAARIAYSGLSQSLRIKPRPSVTLFSDAALAMMVECFSA